MPMLRRVSAVTAFGLLFLPGTLFLLAAAVIADDVKPGETEAAEGDSRSAGAEAPGNEPLSATQDTISRRYRRFEDTLYKIHESLRKSDPDRAELLLRAIGKSKEDRIGQQMTELVELLRDNKQLGDAIERQGDMVTQLQALLDLLLSEDRHKELKEEQARIKRYLEELNRVIGREKANRAENERGAPTDEVAGQQKKIADQAGNLGKTIDKDDQAKQAKARGKEGGKEQNEKGDGTSKEGEPKPGDSRPGESEKSPDGKPGKQGPKPNEGEAGTPKEGDSKPGEGESKGKEGDSQPGDEKPGKPSEGEGKPQEGMPQEGESSEGQPSEGQSGDSQPGQSQQGENKSQPPQSTAGREELERARRAMEQAIDKLKQQKRQDASDHQDEAIAQLQKAKEKLEEILRQLREEERDRFLAMLEARFQRMLAMQLLIYDGTQKLARTPEDDRSGRHAAKSMQLARQEDEIALEATKAIMLLREEGSAVAFPEAVEQVRDDMRIVEGRLEQAETGELTQSIEREIIEALEEMIEALQKEMEKNKEKKDQPQQSQEGAPQDPALVEQLAELKMLRTLQLRVNHRTKRLGQMIEGEQAQDSDLLLQLQNLADRQARIQRATHDLAAGKNK